MDTIKGSGRSTAMPYITEDERKRAFQEYVNSDPLNLKILQASIGKASQTNGASVKEVAFNLGIPVATAASRMNGLAASANLPTSSYPTGGHLRRQMIEWGVIKFTRKGGEG